MKVLVATEKAFAKEAAEGIKEIGQKAGYDVVFLENYKEKSDFLNAVKDADALIVRSDKVDAAVVEAADKLKIVVRAGAGYDNLDLNACTAKNIVAMNTPGQNSNAVAELVFGMMVYMARNKFDGSSGFELKDKMLGLHAFGNVSMNVARIAKGFGMKVYAYDPFVEKSLMAAYDVLPVADAKEMYARCDYVSLHMPLVDATRNFVNYELLKTMKKGATIVNTARAEVICESDLAKIMEERTDLKYVSDIEPKNKAELWEKFPKRVYFTPKKMGAQTEEANVNAGYAAINQIIAFFEKGDVRFRVNR